MIECARNEIQFSHLTRKSISSHTGIKLKHLISYIKLKFPEKEVDSKTMAFYISYSISIFIRKIVSNAISSSRIRKVCSNCVIVSIPRRHFSSPLLENENQEGEYTDATNSSNADESIEQLSQFVKSTNITLSDISHVLQHNIAFSPNYVWILEELFRQKYK